MALTKTKPAAKAAPAKAPKATKATATKAPKGAKASAAAAKPPKAPSVIFEEGAFVKFTGYRSNVPKDEAVFKPDTILYIIEVSNDDKGVLYTAIAASDIAEYQESGDTNVNGGEVAPAEVTELKGSALEKAREQFVPVVRIGRLAEMLDANDDALEVALELNRGIQENYFWLGGAIACILQEGTYLKENGGDYTGEDAFNDFCTNEFSFSGSKGRALARIYTTFSQIEDFDPAVLASVDWSKVSIAERFVTPENVNEVLELAENTTQRNLAVTLKEKYANNEGKTASGKSASRGSSIAKKTLTFRLDEDAADTVELVIQQAMKQTGIENPALALERICVEWADNHVEGDAAKKRINNKAKAAAKARDAATAPAPAEVKAKPAAAAKAPKAAPKKK